MIEEFTLPTEDHVAHLNGDIMSPHKLSGARGALLMVPGGWFAERDAFLGDSYTEADLMFRRIACRVLNLGYVVARYDNRGVTGNEFTIGLKKESSNPLADTERYFNSCVNSEIRRSVTPETLTSDAAAVYHFLSQRPHVDPSNIVVFAHSEGGIHMARLIGVHRIAPKGIVFAGSIAGSPGNLIKWQMVDRYVDELMRWSGGGDGRVSTDDIQTCYGDSFFAEAGISEQELHQRGNVWTEIDARNFFTAKYEAQKKAVNQCGDEVPFPRREGGHLNYVAASHRWIKTFFNDNTPMISLLEHYSGQVAYHFGEIDRQLSTEREVDVLRTHATSMACDPKIVVHRNRGHAFASAKAINGPMDLEAEDIFVEEVVGMLDR